jgi:hypothetical protein
LNSGLYENGTSDYITVSTVTRSASWILTEYNNTNSPGNIGSASFYTVGSEVYP